MNDASVMSVSSDLTFITNEPGKHLSDRFSVLLGANTRFFDCLVGYFFISGFHKLHPALSKTEKIRILVGIKTDRATYELIQSANAQQEFVLEFHAHVRQRLPGEILNEFQKSGDSSEIEDGVRKFVEWIKSGKLEVRAFPSERLHAKLYVMTFVDGHIDKGRVITGSSNFNEPCLVIAPPHLLDEHNPGSWPNVFRDFGVRGFLCESLGKLESLLERDLKKFTTVFIDESHRFRTEDTQSYEMLAQICRGKQVVLVSATPLNNSPQDILSQIKLFQPGKNSTIPERPQS